jgi:hypothetical protein
MEMTKNEIQKVLNSAMSKSKKIVALMEGMEGNTSVVKDLMGVRYQFVYNVWYNHCNINGIEMPTKDKSDTKKAKIIALLEEGKSPGEISKILMVNYNMVFRYRKELELQKAREKTNKATTA